MIGVNVPQAYKRLVILLAHMFYSGQCPPGWWIDAAEGPKKESQAEDLMEDKRAAQLAREARRRAQADTTGLGIVILTALTELQWVEEDEFARSLNLQPKMVRKAMRYLEEEQLLMREHRKETKRARREERNLQSQAGLREAKPAPAAAAAAAGPNGQPAAAAADEADEEAINVGHVISYCALDYPRIVDSVRWRIDTIKKNLIKEMRNNSVEQKYKCPVPSCGKEYTSMDVFDLMNGRSRKLHCGICGTEIEMLLSDGKTGTADERKEKIKRAKELLAQYDNMLGPLIQQLNSIDTITAPDFSNYHAWLANQAAVRSHIAAIEQGTAPGSRPHGQAPKPVFTANTQVVLNFDTGRPANGGSSAAAATTAAGRPAGSAGGAGGAAAAKPLPRFLQSALANNSGKGAPAAAKKPIPPWLKGSMIQQQHQNQQPDSSIAADHAGNNALPLYDSLLGLKPDPEAKQDIKLDFEPVLKTDIDVGAKQEQADALVVEDDDDQWEDAGAASLTAAAASVGGDDGGGNGSAVAVEEDDWEDV